MSIKNTLKTVYSKPGYYLLTGLVAATVMVMYSTVTNLSLITSNLSNGLASTLTLIYALVMGVSTANGNTVATVIVITSILAGVNIALLIYRTRAFGFPTNQGSTSIGGFLAGAFGAGCSACATGLISFIGLSGGLAILPFHGWGIRILSILLLALPIYWLSKDIANGGVCEVKT